MIEVTHKAVYNIEVSLIVLQNDNQLNIQLQGSQY